MSEKAFVRLQEIKNYMKEIPNIVKEKNDAFD